MTSVKTAGRAVVGDNHPFGRTVLCRTVVNTLSTGLDVRRWPQCSAGES
jgi:hypothetical protein